VRSQTFGTAEQEQIDQLAAYLSGTRDSGGQAHLFQQVLDLHTSRHPKSSLEALFHSVTILPWPHGSECGDPFTLFDVVSCKKAPTMPPFRHAMALHHNYRLYLESVFTPHLITVSAARYFHTNIELVLRGHLC
jgi:hypothetical protein